MFSPKSLFRLILYCSLVLILGDTGCKKTPKYNYYITSYPQTIVAGLDVVNFNINNCPSPENETITWDYGDGNVSTGSGGTHLYIEPGNYTVTVLVKGRDSAQTSVSVGAHPVSPHTLAMGGTRIWENYNNNNGRITRSTDTFAINVINSGTVMFHWVSVPFACVDTADKLITFKPGYSGSTLKYYYENDSISYYDYHYTEPFDMHGFDETIIHTQ